MSAEGEAFRSAAGRFCALVEKEEAPDTRGFLIDLHASLADVYAAAARLRPTFDDLSDPPERSLEQERSAQQRLISQVGDDSYSFVFDPWEDTEVVRSMLASDLAEIYAELGSVFADERAEGGEWDWRFAFQSHWGRHAAQALHALHWKIGPAG